MKRQTPRPRPSSMGQKQTSYRGAQMGLPGIGRAQKRTPNQTSFGALACAFGTPWREHATRGCRACDAYTNREER